jgi:uncharacterized membrane protein YkvA (DUF1232 family)
MKRSATEEREIMTPREIATRLKDAAWKPAFFNRLKSRAEKLANDRPKLWGRVGRAARLASHHKAAFGNDYGHLRALFRMLRAWATGAYRPSKLTVVSAVAVVLYILSPIDLIPDFLPAIGLLDDATFFLWVLTRIRGELDRFVQWEGASQTPQDVPLIAS